MNILASIKTDFIPRNRVKAYATLVLAVLGIVFAVFAFGMANDQMAFAKELGNSLASGPTNLVASVINLFC